MNVAKPAATNSAQYAVIFRTHFWDEFTERQYKRLRARVGSGDVFVLVDETRGHVEGIPTTSVFRLTDQQVLSAGYVGAGEGSIQWFSGDIPLYLFQAAYPAYNYYVQIEYDAIINVELDDVINSISEQSIDLVAFQEPGEHSNWHWLETCRGFYREDEVTHLLVCLSIYSSRAIILLSNARLRQAEAFKAGQVSLWPMCEGFVATEAKRQGLNVSNLDLYGDVSAYRWWPPYSEREASRFTSHAFIHPVLEPSRFVPSLLRKEPIPSIGQLLSPTSWVHERLRKLGLRDYVLALFGRSYWRALSQAVRRRINASGTT